MIRNYIILIAATVTGWGLLFPGPSSAQQTVQLARDPDLSPDGQRLTFAWRGDIWIAALKRGSIRQLTNSTDNESNPKFSPDGKRIAFNSDRYGGANHVYVVSASGGQPKQLTFHSEGCSLLQWIDDGESLLVSANRDQYWRDAGRFFRIASKPRSPETILFDAAGENGRISPDGDQMLFTREGVAWWRKGYYGSQSSQIWKYDFKSEEYEQLCDDETGALSPLWAPDGKTFYFVSGRDGVFNLYSRKIEGGEAKQLTQFKDDSVVMPCISSDGKTIVFRHLFDFYSLQPETGKPPKKLTLKCRADQTLDPTKNVTLSSASQVSFSEDGLEVAFVAGGDVWVMDTVLREPKQITKTPEQESSVAFAPDGQSIWFVSDAEGQSDIWRATRKDSEQYWWLNEEILLERVTNDSDLESQIRFSPVGDRVAFVKGRGDLWLMNADGSDARRFLESWNAPDYDWSPDGRWMTWSISDNNFNSDIFVAPLDGSEPPLNVSRHPDNDSGPVWSPDGKMIAFTGRRLGDERDIWFFYLQKSDDEIDERDRKMTEALEKLKKARQAKPDKSEDSPAGKKNDDPQESNKRGGKDPKNDEPQSDEKQEDSPKKDNDDKNDTKKEKEKIPEVVVDADGINERIRRVSIPDTGEGGLFWSHDSKKLAFTATVDGKTGTYTVEPAGKLEPKLLSEKTGRQNRWIKEGNLILWLADGSPGSLDSGGKATSYSFRALSQVEVEAHHKAGFDLAWREMRDGFYDENLNNRNWDDIRRKYRDVAAKVPDARAFGDVVNMMLGELNGSHLGFSSGGGAGRGRRGGGGISTGGDAWNESTAHFGLRFDTQHAGPGLLVRDVIYGSPAWRMECRVEAGETVVAIDGTEVDPGMDLTKVLNGPLPRDVILRIKNREGVDRDVTIRPITFGGARRLLYQHWVRGNQEKVKQASNDRFGYIHISGMNMGSFYEFERDLFAIAGGKEGLVIDVRENGGGSTTDHLLTILTQPVHAIAVPRGGGPGYPQDRMVYAPWNQPIVVLCNQNSFSNAEIFSHAVKTLKRGRVVGVPTAGGVISTGGTAIMDLGFLRMPFRGWYLINDGQDMELNGAVPDFVIWPKPGDMMQGVDQQLEKAISVLDEDVTAWKARPQLKLEKASERPRR